jgi:fumarylacetoacetase
MIDHTHDAAATCWVAGADDHAAFPVQNLPLGLFAPPGDAPRIGTAIGDWVLDLATLAERLPADLGPALVQPELNALFSFAPDARRALRHAVFGLLTDPGQRGLVAPQLHAVTDVTMHLPARIGDYTDFYVGIHHATNIGRQFRPDQPLLPNYRYIPIGYHGRASSVRVSGTPLVRPSGQRKRPDAEAPDFGPCQKLDYELELGVWISGENVLGDPVPIAHARRRMAGLCLLNDWSARDLQAWEYQPLGPFLAKNFMTTVSPWVVTAEALAPFRVAQPPRPIADPQPLPYLWDETDQQTGAFAITLDVSFTSAKMREAGLPAQRLSSGPASNMYWTVAQMIAHHTSNGCDLHPGDLLGTGTISGPLSDAFGSLIELSNGGRDPVALPTGETRTFLEDGDALMLSGCATAPGFRTIGFGDCAGMILPSR